MKKLYLYLALAILAAAAIVAFTLWQAPKASVLAPTSSATSTTQPAVVATSSTGANTATKSLVSDLPLHTYLTLGNITYVLPETAPANIAAIPPASYIVERVFAKYNATTTPVYIPISDSASWDSLGYKATVFVSDTKEACHAVSGSQEKYTSASGINFNVFSGTANQESYSYKMKTYQLPHGNDCYNIGVFEEFKNLTKSDLNGHDASTTEATRSAESNRVYTLLTRLADSVNIK